MPKEKITTIRIRQKVKNDLNKLKVHPRETHEGVIKRLIKGEQK